MYNNIINKLLSFFYMKLKEANVKRLRSYLGYCGENVKMECIRLNSLVTEIE